MRPIKFRAWDGNKMSEDWHLHDIWCAASGRGAPHPTLPYYNNPGTIIMQFTGLLDKNGKEVYEGDLIKDEHGTIGQIIWEKTSTGFIASVRQVEGYNRDFGIYEGLHKVIGNIYENPELVK